MAWDTGRNSSMPWQWSPCTWVTMTPSSRLTFASSSCCLRSGPQSTRMRFPALSTKIDVLSRALRGSSGSQRPQSFPIFGTPVDVPQPRILSLKGRSLLCLAEKPKEIRGGLLAQSVGLLASQLGNKRGGVGDERRLAFLPAMRDGRQEG